MTDKEAKAEELRQKRELRAFQLEEKNKAKEETKTKFTALIIIIIIAIIGYFISDKDTGKTDSGPDRSIPSSLPSQTTATLMAQEVIKRQLPTNSAEFDGMGSFTYYPLDTIYKVVGWVDFKNLYNAPLRKRYFIQLKYTGGDENYGSSYKVISLDFE